MALKAASLAALLLGVGGARIHKRKTIPGIAIVNGTDAEPCVWKWQVGLTRPGDDRPFCGGTLISPTWVVTAAHCIGSHVPDGLDVVAGEILAGKGERRSSKRTIVAPGLLPAPLGTDMALIELTEPYALNECINVPKLPASGEDPPSGTQCWITGWGRLADGAPGATTLQQAKTEIQSHLMCRLRLDLLVKKGELCVYGKYNENPTSACNGDSGGPLVCEMDGEMTFYGATSRGKACSGTSIYAGVPAAMDWIKSVTGL